MDSCNSMDKERTVYNVSWSCWFWKCDCECYCTPPQHQVPYSLWHAEDFFHPEKSWRLRPGLNPRTWVLEGSTLPLDYQNRFFQHITMTELKNVKFQCAVSNTYFTLSPRNDKLSCTHNQFFSPSSYFCHVLMVNSHTMWLSWCTLLFLSTKKSVKV